MIQPLTPTSPNYPQRLLDLEDRPQKLYVWGKLPVLNSKISVAIVGTRRPTVYGRQVTLSLARELAKRRVVIVSGLMYGIDEIAMRAAITAGGITIGVWAGGLSASSLGSRLALAKDVVSSGGAVVSEWPKSQLPNKGLFPLRNRIISGLSQAVVVTEGKIRSGSMITARNAVEQSREILAVPGPITSPTSAGPNELLYLGATPARSVDDIINMLH